MIAIRDHFNTAEFPVLDVNEHLARRVIRAESEIRNRAHASHWTVRTRNSKVDAGAAAWAAKTGYTYVIDLWQIERGFSASMFKHPTQEVGFNGR